MLPRFVRPNLPQFRQDPLGNNVTFSSVKSRFIEPTLSMTIRLPMRLVRAMSMSCSVTVSGLPQTTAPASTISAYFAVRIFA
jgi:hypothetical protein